MTASANAGKTEVPTVPGRLPLLGHTAAILRQRLAFTTELRTHGLGRAGLPGQTTAALRHHRKIGAPSAHRRHGQVRQGPLHRQTAAGVRERPGQHRRRIPPPATADDPTHLPPPSAHPVFGDDDRTGRRSGEFLAGWTSAGVGPGHAGPRDHRDRPDAVLHRLRAVGERGDPGAHADAHPARRGPGPCRPPGSRSCPGCRTCGA